MDKKNTHRCETTYALMVIYLQLIGNYTIDQIAKLIDEPAESIRSAKISDYVPHTLQSEIKLIKLFNKVLRLNNQPS